jgi:putative transposase
VGEGRFGVEEKFEIADEWWEKIQPLIPPEPAKPFGGRPRMDDRRALTAILYVLRTGCQWNALPRSLGASSTVHDRFQKWREAGLFQKLWEAGLQEYDQARGIEWEWQSVDGAMTKAPLGGKRDRAQPHGPRKERNQTESAHRRRGRANCRGC